MRDPVGHAINHPLRKRMIEALWHNSEPLTVESFHSEYVGEERVTLPMVAYHVGQLRRDGIVQLEDSPKPFERRSLVLGGPNCGEAVRRLGLTAT